MVTNQVFLSFIFIVNGIVIGLLFDFFRILRKTFKTKDIVTYIQDILFWILTGIILLYSIFTFNNGEIRLFMFLAIMIGISIYMLIFSSYIIKINVTIINLIKNIISKVLNILFIPFKYIYKLFNKIFFKPINFLIINIRKNFTKNLKKVYNNTKKIKNIKKTVKNWKYKKGFWKKCRII